MINAIFTGSRKLSRRAWLLLAVGALTACTQKPAGTATEIPTVSFSRNASPVFDRTSTFVMWVLDNPHEGAPTRLQVTFGSMTIAEGTPKPSGGSWVISFRVDCNAISGHNAPTDCRTLPAAPGTKLVYKTEDSDLFLQGFFQLIPFAAPVPDRSHVTLSKFARQPGEAISIDFEVIGPVNNEVAAGRIDAVMCADGELYRDGRCQPLPPLQ